MNNDPKKTNENENELPQTKEFEEEFRNNKGE